MFDMTPIVQAAATLFAAIVTAFVVPYIKSRTSAAQQAQMNAWVRIAVAAVEQTCKDFKGAEKKKKVYDWLRQHGILVDEERVDAMIEAAVYELKNGVIPVGSGGPMESEGAL